MDTPTTNRAEFLMNLLVFTTFCLVFLDIFQEGSSKWVGAQGHHRTVSRSQSAELCLVLARGAPSNDFYLVMRHRASP